MIESPETATVDYDPFKGNLIEKVVPITEPQQEIWVSCVLGGDEANLAYNESMSLRFMGKVDRKAITQAVRQLIARHEALRSSFSGDGSKMLIYENIDDVTEFLDISREPEEGQRKIIDVHANSDAEKTFDLTDGPLVRFTLFKQADTEYLLHISAHHLVCDGWSFGVMLEDMSAIYNSIVDNGPSPEEPIQFSEYAIEDYRFSRSAEYEAVERHWINQYKNRLPGFELPVDFERSALRTFKSRRDDYVIEKPLADEVKKIAASQNCSFVTALMSVFEILMYQVSGKKDVVLGVPTAGQAATDFYNLIGHCVNLLPLRTHIDPEMRFSDYLKQRKGELLDDYDHQRFTFGSLLKKILVQRDMSRIPLVPVSFNIDIGMDKDVSFRGLDYEIIYNPRKAETFEIFLNITETKDKYVFQWSYNTNLFRKETIKKWMGTYKFLLNQICKDVHQKISELKPFSESIVANSFAHKNDTYKKIPDTNTLRLFGTIADRYKNNPAVEFNNERVSYADLNNLANKLANYLKAEGLTGNNIAAFSLDRSIWLPATMLAIMKCGAAYLPLDPEFPENRIRFMLNDSDAFCNITNRRNAGRYKSAAREIILEDVIQKIDSFPDTDPEVDFDQKGLVYVIYTSGSTGQPKGVKVTHRNLLNFLLAMQSIFSTDEQSRLMAVTTISFDIAGLEIFLPLISGGTLVLADENTVRDGEILLKQIVDKKINIIQATPSTFKILLNAKTNTTPLPVTALCGGEALPKKLATELLNHFDRVYNMYGPTETTIWSTVAEVEKGNSQITIGKPIDNTRVYILNDKGELLPDGVAGEICIGGEGVAAGYYNRSDLSEEKFIPKPFKSAETGKIYKTGDLGYYLPNGDIVCLGRNDQQAKIRGYRIELEDIEHHIQNIVGIKDVVCVVQKGKNDEHKLIAFVILRDKEKGITKKKILEWREELNKSLPHYMIPEEFKSLDEFPLTPNKKVDRKKLQTLDDNLIPENTLIKNETDHRAEIIKNIWASELNIPDIEEEDDFFELGGHSMTAIRVMSRIEKETGSKLPISALFENPTIKDLARLIKAPSYRPNKIVVPIKRKGTKTPIFLLHGGGLNVLIYKRIGEFFDEDQPLYGLQGLGLDGDLTHLKSIQSIANRYLNEVFEIDSEGPYIFIGYSFGGIIGYEMVRQLLAMGKKIKFFGVLDTYAKPTESKISYYTNKVLRQFKKAAFFGRSFIQRPRETYEYQKLRLQRLFDKSYQVSEEDQIFDFDETVIKAYDDAYDNYQMIPMDITVHLFRVEKRLYYLDDLVYLGWNKYAKRGVKIHPIPGDHRTFLNPPNNKILAELIKSAVESEK